MMRTGLLSACCAVAATGCSQQQDLRGDAPRYAEAAVAPYIGTTIRYYDVEGTDVRTIRASLNSLGLEDQNDHTTHDALTNWQARWDWSNGPDGRCDLSQLRYKFSITVTLPHLEDEDRLPLELRKQWGNYMAALISHEIGHVRNAYAHRMQAGDAVRSSTCGSANATGEAVLAELRKFDARYDSNTRHGATQGAIFPA